MSDLMLFCGNANSELTQEISHFLGVPVGQAIVSKFSDGENHVEIINNVYLTFDLTACLISCKYLSHDLHLHHAFLIHCKYLKRSG